MQVLHPAMDMLLQSDEWARWDETLQRMWYPGADMASFLQCVAAFKEVVASRASQMSALGTSAQIATSLRSQDALPAPYPQPESIK